MTDPTIAAFAAGYAAIGAVLVALIRLAGGHRSVQVRDQSLVNANLNDEVTRLTEQVDRLEAKIDRLDRQQEIRARSFAAEIKLLHAYIIELGGDPHSLPTVRPAE